MLYVRLVTKAGNHCQVTFEPQPNGNLISYQLFAAPPTPRDQQECNELLIALLEHLFPEKQFEPPVKIEEPRHTVH